MNFRMFTEAAGKQRKVAINVESVETVNEFDGFVSLYGHGGKHLADVLEDFDTVLARLNTIAG